MQQAILVNDEDIRQLKSGVTLQLAVEGQTVLLMYKGGAVLASNAAKARAALAAKWRSPRGRKALLEAAKRGARTRMAKNGKAPA